MINIPPQGFTRLTGSERKPPVSARQIGPVDPNERIEVSVYLRDPSTSNLVSNTSEHAQQPGRRMTRAEYIANHSAAPDDLAKVETFARQHHLTVVETDPVGRKVVLAGTAVAMMTAFATELQQYEYEGGTFRGRTGPLHIPSELDQIVVGVFGLDNRPQARPHLRYAHPMTTATPRANVTPTSYTPPQVAQLYDFPSGLDGSGQCIALIELGGGYTDQDLTTSFQQLGMPTPQVISVSVDNGQNSPGDPHGADGEVALDIQVADSIAPGACIAVYFAPDASDRSFIDAVTQAIHDTTHNPSVISISWGGPEVDWTAQSMQAMDHAFQAAAGLGVTVCAAAGDNGSGDGVTTDQLAHVDFPASNPFVLGCGGTRLEATNNQVTSEGVWNELAQNEGATGGGVSDVFGLPSWQANAHVPPSINDHRAGRGVPDVAGNADPETGYQIYVDGQSSVIGGTSAVAPLWASLIALLNQKRGQAVGYLNPFLYQNYQQLLQSDGLRDVTTGNNGGYSAGPGWNACTGLGTPDGAKLLAVLISAPQQPTKEREERERVFTPQLLNLGQGSWQSHMYGDRPYFVYTPANYHVGTAVPLIVILHGCGQFPWDIAYDTQMNELADQQQFLVVYPQHTEPGLGDVNPILCWNFFYADNQLRGSGEPASLAGIVQTVQNTLQWTIDRKRIYVAGVSSGGGMTAILGATYPDLFAAIGVHSGAEYQWAQLPQPLPLSQPVAVGAQAQAHVTMAPPSDERVFFREGFLSVLPPDLILLSKERKPMQRWGPSHGWYRRLCFTGPLTR